MPNTMLSHLTAPENPARLDHSDGAGASQLCLINVVYISDTSSSRSDAAVVSDRQ